MSKIIEFIPTDPADLQPQADGSAETQNNLYDLKAPALVTDPMTLTGPNNKIFTWTPTELLYKDAAGQLDYIVGSAPVSLSILNRQVKYLRSFPESDDIFNAEGQRVKHWTILHEPARNPAEYMSKEGLKFGISGLITGLPIAPGEYDKIETESFILPQPAIHDLEGNEISGSYEIKDSDQGQQLFIYFPAEFLKNAIYPVTIDPTVIINSAYTVYTQARPQKLSNGWIVATIHDFSNQNIHWYVSKDNGTTFTELCYSGTLSGSGIAFMGVCSYNNMLYTIAAGTSTFLFFKFDVTTVSDIAQSGVNIDSNQQSYQGCCIAVSSTGELAAGIISADPSYPASYNLRVRISTDGGNTWGSAEQVTTNNASGYMNRPVTIVYDSNNKPVYIVIFSNSSGEYYVKCYKKGSLGTYTTLASANETYNNPVLLLKKHGSNIGRLWAVWEHNDSSYYTYANIEAAYSDDGGGTWSSVIKITKDPSHDNTCPILAEKPNGDLLLFYIQGTVIYRTCLNGGTLFDNPVAISGSQTKVSIMDYAVNSVLAYLWQTSSDVEFDKFQYNQAPTAPTNLSPGTGSAIDRAVINRLSWQFSDPDSGDLQSKFDLNWRVQGAGSWNTITATATNNYYDVPAGTFPHGSIEWEVRTYDQLSIVSPYSAIQVITAGDKPAAPQITSPTDGSTISDPQPTITWSSYDQVSYEVMANAWDSGEVSGTNKSQTIGIKLSNGSSAVIKVRTKNTDGLWSDWSISTVTETYTSPATPAIAITNDNELFANIITITNPDPAGGQPAIAYNDIYRRQLGESDFTRIATGVDNNGAFKDYTAAFNTVYEYKAVAYGNNGTISESLLSQGSLNHSGEILSNTADYTDILNVKANDRGAKQETKSTTLHFEGRKFDNVYFYDQQSASKNLAAYIPDLNSLNKLKSLEESQQTLLYRDGSTKLFCYINGGISSKDNLNGGYDVSFNISAIDFVEAV